jgi:zinc finger protein CreA/MIG
MPALAPMEVADPYNVGSPPVQASQQSKGLRLGDIINRPDGAQRKLPIPRVHVHDLLNNHSTGLGFSSASSSASNSIAGADLAERM